MVSTRSGKTSYVINFPDEDMPIRGNQHPISEYFAHLDVVEKTHPSKTQIQTSRSMCTGFQLFSQKNGSSEGKC